MSISVGDRVQVPCFISPSGKYKPWARTNPPPAGSPVVDATVVGLNPLTVQLDVVYGSVTGVAEEQFVTVIGASSAPAVTVTSAPSHGVIQSIHSTPKQAFHFNTGDRVRIPCYVSSSGHNKPWARGSKPPTGAPEEEGVVYSLNPPTIILDSGVMGPAELAYAIPVGAAAAAMPKIVAPNGGTGHAFTPKAPMGFQTTKVYTPPIKATKPIYSGPVSHPIGGGVCCKQCRDINPYAEPNQPDGSFLCRQCRQDPFRFRM